jgi:hypothetical protein
MATPSSSLYGTEAYVPTEVSGGDSGGNDSSGWLSGLGDLFSGVGSAVATGLKASQVRNVQPSSGFVFNPTTGQYYNPVTGQALTSTGSLTSAGLGGSLFSNNSTLMIILLAVIAFLAFRHKG